MSTEAGWKNGDLAAAQAPGQAPADAAEQTPADADEQAPGQAVGQAAIEAVRRWARGLIAFRWRSLSTRIIAWTFVPTVIILALVAYVAYSAYQRTTEDLVIERNQELARLAAGELSSGIHEYSGILDAVGQVLALAGDDPQKRAEALQEAKSKLAVFDGGVLFLDSFGVVRLSEPPRPDALWEDWSNRPYFRQSFLTRGPAFSGIVYDGPKEDEVIAVAVPVTGGRGEFLGSVVGMFRLNVTSISAFYGGILKLRLSDTATIALVDGNGRVLYHTDGALIGMDRSGQPAVQQVLVGKVGSLRARNADGEEIVAGYAPVAGTQWGLITEETRADLMRASAGAIRSLLILLILGVAAPTVLVTFAVRRITQPIVELTDAARQVAHGNFDQRIRTGAHDEVEDLAAQFNLMAAELQDSYARLGERVADRTRELGALNAIALSVSGTLDLREILEEALDTTLEVMGLSSGVAYRVVENVPQPGGTPGQGPSHGSGQALEMMVFRGMPEEIARRSADLLISSGAAGAALAQRKPVFRVVADYPEGEIKRMAQAIGFTWAGSVPLVAKDRALGVISLGGSGDVRTITPEEMALLEGIGRQVGMALENARLYERAEEMAVAAERGRLARDLHDAVTQTLFSASLIAEVLPKIWDRNPAEGRRRLDELRQLTRGALAEMRTLLLELRPSALTEAKFGDLIKQLGESVTGRARVPVTVLIEGDCRLPADVQVALYRIAQEALNNIAKHSGATRAGVHLCAGPERLTLHIEDNGDGFDRSSVPAGHLGLGIMEERAATVGAGLVLDSAPGAGTRIDVTWPAEGGSPNS